FVKQSVAASFYDSKYIFKAIDATIIGIGNLAVFRSGVKVANAADLMLQVWLRLGHMLDICQIFIIHSQNKIKIVQVKSFKTARFGVQFNSVLISGALTFAVGRISLVISGGTRRVNFEIVSIATFIHYMLEKAFRCRTSANIAQANEAYLEMIIFGNRMIKS